MQCLEPRGGKIVSGFSVELCRQKASRQEGGKERLKAKGRRERLKAERQEGREKKERFATPAVRNQA
jgi:hypothetical protein